MKIFEYQSTEVSEQAD